MNLFYRISGLCGNCDRTIYHFYKGSEDDVKEYIKSEHCICNFCKRSLKGIKTNVTSINEMFSLSDDGVLYFNNNPVITLNFTDIGIDTDNLLIAGFNGKITVRSSVRGISKGRAKRNIYIKPASIEIEKESI